MNPETLSPELANILRVLPFVSDDDGSELDLWVPDWDGGKDALIARGEEYAETALAVARQFQVPALIALIMRDMILCGRFGAVEAGFVAAIASAARVGSYS
jgi:hypothetical protein